MIQNYLFPSKEKADNILEQYPMPDKVINHSKEVSRCAVIIGLQVKYPYLELLRVGGLLHDIGRHKYCTENKFSVQEDRHEYETGALLKSLGFLEFGDMLARHPLGGLTVHETKILSYPEPVDLMPNSIESKIICIADKIRPTEGIITLEQKIEDYKASKRLHERYFSKLPGLLDLTIDRVTKIWHELESLGMNVNNLN